MDEKNDHSLSSEHIESNALYYEYSSSADPIRSGFINKVPFIVFPSRLHEEGLTAEIPLDISHHLGCSYPATSPALLANFVHILPGEHLKIQHNATSHLFYVMRGQGHTQVNDQDIAWSAGDFFILPQHQEALHHAETDSALYYVHDEPLLNY